LSYPRPTFLKTSPNIKIAITRNANGKEVVMMVVKRMRILRRAKGLSQAHVARQADLHAASVSLIESGRLRPYPSQLARIAEVLGVPADDAGRLLDEIELPDVEFDSDAEFKK